jgi:hypothetical protein
VVEVVAVHELDSDSDSDEDNNSGGWGTGATSMVSDLSDSQRGSNLCRFNQHDHVGLL